MSMSAPVSSFGSFTTPVPHMDDREGASGLEGVIGRHESPGPSTSSALHTTNTQKNASENSRAHRQQWPNPIAGDPLQTLTANRHSDS